MNAGFRHKIKGRNPKRYGATDRQKQSILNSRYFLTKETFYELINVVTYRTPKFEGDKTNRLFLRHDESAG